MAMTGPSLWYCALHIESLPDSRRLSERAPSWRSWVDPDVSEQQAPQAGRGLARAQLAQSGGFALGGRLSELAVAA